MVSLITRLICILHLVFIILTTIYYSLTTNLTDQQVNRVTNTRYYILTTIRYSLIKEGKMKIAVYPGSFDPVTNGHLNIIERTTKIFDKLIVTVAIDSKKSTLFSAQERTDMIKEATKDLENVKVLSFSGLLTDFVRKNKANIIIRGMRAISDFEHESQLALMNKRLAPEIETIFMVTCSKYSYLNSSIVKEIASLNGNISQLVPEIVEKNLKTLFLNKKA